jgi:hypothetical protein
MCNKSLIGEVAHRRIENPAYVGRESAILLGNGSKCGLSDNYKKRSGVRRGTKFFDLTWSGDGPVISFGNLGVCSHPGIKSEAICDLQQKISIYLVRIRFTAFREYLRNFPAEICLCALGIKSELNCNA